MALFRRQYSHRDTPAEQLLSPACSHPYDRCLHGCILQTLPLENELHDDESAVDIFGAFEKSTAAWMSALDDMGAYVAGIVEAHNEVFDRRHQPVAGVSREQRRARQHSTQLQRQKTEEAANSVIKNLRSPAIASIYDRMDPRVGATGRELLGRAHLDEISDTLSGPPDEEADTANKFITLYTAELSSRVELSRVLYGDPELGRQLLGPHSLEVLPEGMRSIIANELLRPADDSIVHGFLIQYPLEEHSLTFSEYVQHNHHTASIRASLATLATGACIAGAPACPANGYGLCEGIMQALPEDQLPPEVKANLDKVRIDSSRQAMNELMATARRYATDELFNSGIAIEVSDQSSTQPQTHNTKRAAKRPRSRTHRISSLPEIERKQRSVQVLFTEEKDIRINASDIDDEQLLGETIEQIIATSVFQDYINKHIESRDNLKAFFTAALHEILGNTRFTEQSNGIKMMQRAQFRVGDHVYPWYRLSGRQFHDSDVTGGDPIIDGTRIFFVAGSDKEKDSRLVFFRGPIFKQGIENDPDGHFLPSR